MPDISSGFKLLIGLPNSPARIDTGWLGGMVTNFGLANFATENLDYLDSCALSASFAPLDANDYRLRNIIAWSNNVTEEIAGTKPGPFYYGWRRKTFKFDVGVGPCSVYKVGIIAFTNNNRIIDYANYFSVELLAPYGEEPLEVLANETVTVVYELRIYPYLDDLVRILPVEHNTTGDQVINVTMRAARVGDSTIWTPTGKPIKPLVLERNYVSDGPIGSKTTFPGGVPITVESIEKLPSPQDGIYPWRAQWSQTGIHFPSNGVSAGYFEVPGIGAYQLGFDPKFYTDDEASRILKLEYSFFVNRCTVAPSRNPYDFIVAVDMTTPVSFTINWVIEEQETDCTVDWGDGSEIIHITAWDDANLSYTYTTPGIYEIHINGTCAAPKFIVPYNTYVIDIIQWGNLIGARDWTRSFEGCPLTVISAPDGFSPEYQILIELFYLCELLSTENEILKVYHTENVVNTRGMFYGCIKFSSDLSLWDMGQVVDTSYMFYNCHVFESDLSAWNTQNVIRMCSMFEGSSIFNSDIHNWVVSNVTTTNSMFSSAYQFNSELNNWDVHNVADMRLMFYDASKFNQPLDNWDISGVKGYLCSTELGDIITGLDYMFSGATSFERDLSSWDVSNFIYSTNPPYINPPYHFSFLSPLDDHPEFLPVWPTSGVLPDITLECPDYCNPSYIPVEPLPILKIVSTDLYPIEVEEPITSQGSVVEGSMMGKQYEYFTIVNYTPLGGNLVDEFHYVYHTQYPEDFVTIINYTTLGGTIGGVLGEAPTEQITSTALLITGEVAGAIVSIYTPVESITSTALIVSGELE